MKLVKIGDIAEFINGYAFKPEHWGNIGKKIIRIQNLTDPTKPYNATTFDVPEKYIVNDGDMLVSWSATIDIFEWHDEPAYLNQHIFKVVFDQKKVDKYYFRFALKQTIDSLTKFAHGSTMKHIVKGDFEKHKIPLPSLEDQQKIAYILSKAEALTQKRKETLQLLDEFLKSTFLDMFGDPVKNPKGWEKEKMKEFSKVRIGPFGSLLHSEDYIQGGVPLINPSHIKDGKIFTDSKLTVSKEKMKQLSAYIVKRGDIILGRRGEIGRCAAVTENEEGFLCGTGSIFIRIFKELNPIFLYSVISSSSIKRVLENDAKGITMKNLNSGNIESLKIPVPPLQLQTQFAKMVEKVKGIKQQQEASLKEIENLYQSLLQRAFKGELELAAVKIREEINEDLIFEVLNSLKIISNDDLKLLDRNDAAKKNIISEVTNIVNSNIEKNTNVERTREAISQIISRNMSHNLGSFVSLQDFVKNSLKTGRFSSLPDYINQNIINITVGQQSEDNNYTIEEERPKIEADTFENEFENLEGGFATEEEAQPILEALKDDLEIYLDSLPPIKSTNVDLIKKIKGLDFQVKQAGKIDFDEDYAIYRILFKRFDKKDSIPFAAVFDYLHDFKDMKYDIAKSFIMNNLIKESSCFEQVYNEEMGRVELKLKL